MCVCVYIYMCVYIYIYIYIYIYMCVCVCVCVCVSCGHMYIMDVQRYARFSNLTALLDIIIEDDSM